MKFCARLINVFLLIALIVPLTVGQAAPLPQTPTPQERAQALLDSMTPEERVGQLFLVTFRGPEASSLMYDLITRYHVGGVVLQANNDNFKALDQTLPILVGMTRQIQTWEYTNSQQSQFIPNTTTSFTPAFVPLFIGVSQEGDGYPYDQILGDFANGLTPLPSQMAVGATWDSENARKVGEVLGRELAALGVNLLFGPILDVLENPHTNGGADLSVRSFGGDPSWVGEMGQAYITGLHQGSQGRMAVIAKYFPGYGSSDRLPEEEVATVRKSLEQLQQVDLMPFYAVTGNAPTVEATTDGLLTAHARYQAFQGNIRQITRPIGLDRTAFSLLMQLPAIQSWRSAGGVMVSDSLGSEALRKFYEDSGDTFIARFVAQNAFLAGNDLLYLGDFSSANEGQEGENVISTIQYFTQKYRDDDVFAQRVDSSVLRILTLKYKLYNYPFTLTKAMVPRDLPSTVGRSDRVTFEIAQKAATLLNPSIEDLAETMPSAPGRSDKIVFIIDNRTARQCSACPVQSVFGLNPEQAVYALQDMVIRLYSPQAGGQILPSNLSSYSFTQLEELLNIGPGVMDMERILLQANWIVFVALNETPDISSSYAMQRFLSERTDLIQQKQVVVFALSAPYYLDSTELTKVAAYYALYSKAPRFIDVAARLLFQDITASGASPVTVASTGYDIKTVVQPHPQQNIEIMLDVPPATDPVSTATPTPEEPPILRIGDSIAVRTGVIYDHNGHLVPDGTIVNFIVFHPETGSSQIPGTAATSDGIARAVIRVDTPGILQIVAQSGQARSATPLQFIIPLENPPIIEPTFTITLTPSPTVTVTPPPTPTLTPTLALISTRSTASMGDWFMATMISVIVSLVSFWVSSLVGQFRWGIRGALLALIGGLLSYSYLAIGMPGSASLIQDSGSWGVVEITLLGIAVGWISSLVWRAVSETRDRSNT